MFEASAAGALLQIMIWFLLDFDRLSQDGVNENRMSEDAKYVANLNVVRADDIPRSIGDSRLVGKRDDMERVQITRKEN